MRWDFFRRSEPDDLAARTGSAARDERLSEYLDGSLSVDERRTVEEDLERDAGMRTMLEGMALVRDGMHELGMMRSPRSFTITASRRPRSTALPRLELGMRIATAAASVALVAVFIGPTFLGSMGGDDSASGEPVIVQARAGSGGEVASDAATGTVESFAASAAAPTEAPADAGAAGATGPVGGGIESAVPPSPESGGAAPATPESAAALAPATDGAGGAAAANPPAAEGGTPAAEVTPLAAEGTPLAQGAASPVEETSPTAALKSPPSGEVATTALDEGSSGTDWVQWSRIGAGVAVGALALGTAGLWWQRRRSGQYGM